MACDVTEIRDEDELEVYGDEIQTSIQLSSYSFEVSYISYVFNNFFFSFFL